MIARLLTAILQATASREAERAEALFPPRVLPYLRAMYHHLSIGVKSLDRAGEFYDAALAPLGYVRVMNHPRAIGYGPSGFKGEAPFAILDAGAEAAPPGRGFHLAFAAPSAEAINLFHAAALASGGQDEGAPGIRQHYDPGYYAAFVRDLDGHRLEAVFWPDMPR